MVNRGILKLLEPQKWAVKVNIGGVDKAEAVGQSGWRCRLLDDLPIDRENRLERRTWRFLASDVRDGDCGKISFWPNGYLGVEGSI